MTENYIYAIIALLPLAAGMVVTQVNPYHALVVRGILGAMAALVYTVLGAADVALTEALVGTMLAITLNAIAVRSSLVMRLGVLETGEVKEQTDATPLPDSSPEHQSEHKTDRHFGQLLKDFRAVFGKYHLRLELVPYASPQALHRALMDREIHAVCTRSTFKSTFKAQFEAKGNAIEAAGDHPYHTITRIRRLYDIMQTELASPVTAVTYVSVTEAGGKS